MVATRLVISALLGLSATFATVGCSNDVTVSVPQNVAFVVMTHKRPAELAELLFNLSSPAVMDALRSAGYSSRLVIAESCGKCDPLAVMTTKAAIDFLSPRFEQIYLTVDHLLVKRFRLPLSEVRLPEQLSTRAAGKRDAQLNLYGGLACALNGHGADFAVVIEDDVELASDFADVLVRMLQSRALAPEVPHFATGNASRLCSPSDSGAWAVQETHIDPLKFFDLNEAARVNMQSAQQASRAVTQAQGHAASMGVKWRPSIAVGNADWQAEEAMVPLHQRAYTLENLHVTPRVVFRVLSWYVSSSLWKAGLASQLLSSAIWAPQVPAELLQAVQASVVDTETHTRMRATSPRPGVTALENLPGIDFALVADGDLTVGMSPAALPWAEQARWPGFKDCLFCDNYCHDHVVEEGVRGGTLLAPVWPRVTQRAGVSGMSGDGSLDALPPAGAAKGAVNAPVSLRWLSPLLPIPGDSSWNIFGALHQGCHVTLRMQVPQPIQGKEEAPKNTARALAVAQLQLLWAHLVLPTKQDSFTVACPPHAVLWAAASQPFVQVLLVVVPSLVLAAVLCCFNRRLAFCWRCRWALNGWLAAKPKRG